MEVIVTISNDPISGFERTAEMLIFDWRPREKYIRLETFISVMFPNKSAKKSIRIPDYQVELMCDNNSIVDPKTGEFVMVNADGIALSVNPVTNQPLPGVGQYDFYTSLAQQGPIDVVGLIKMLVTRADTLKRFDI